MEQNQIHITFLIHRDSTEKRWFIKKIINGQNGNIWKHKAVVILIRLTARIFLKREEDHNNAEKYQMQDN